MKRHGSRIDPPNRFETVRREFDPAALDWDPEIDEPAADRGIEYLDDNSQTIVTENQSPDIPFRYSLNPYRGCIHGCSYCYARPTHEYIGLGAGLDFETRIVVKREAPRLFREFLSRARWIPEPITFSGVTDCYQPAERQFELTRQCLQIALEARQPVSVITKNALVLRDLQILGDLARHQLVHVYLSITTLEAALAREMEPRTSIPAARLRAVQTLAEAGVPTGVMVAPVIPGLNDSEVPAILKAARDAGAATAGYVLLRLPLTVKPVFQEWLQRTQPLKAERVLSRIRQTRDGQLNSSQWGQRGVGTGQIADQIHAMFKIFRSQLGLDQSLPPHNTADFRPPTGPDGQQRLF